MFNMGANMNRIKFLYLDPKRKVKCYNKYFINWYVFHTKKYDEGIKIYNNGICIKGSISNKFEVGYYDKLQDVNELWYYRSKDAMFLFKCYWYDTNRGIRLDLHHCVVEINKIEESTTSQNQRCFHLCKTMPTNVLCIHFFIYKWS